MAPRSPRGVRAHHSSAAQLRIAVPQGMQFRLATRNGTVQRGLRQKPTLYGLCTARKLNAPRMAKISAESAASGCKTLARAKPVCNFHGTCGSRQTCVYWRAPQSTGLIREAWLVTRISETLRCRYCEFGAKNYSVPSASRGGS